MTRATAAPAPARAPQWTARDALAIGIVVAVSAALVWPQLFHDWYSWDDGAMAQVADRVLHGQLPHRDFDDPWTGGWSFYQALIFRLFGESLRWIRVPIFAVWLASLALGFRLARRWIDLVPSAVATLAWAVWSLYAWHFPLLNWYYAPLALTAVWCIVRFRETQQVGFVVAAGAVAGVAILMKVTGFYLLAALLLWTAAHAAQPHAASPRMAPPRAAGDDARSRDAEAAAVDANGGTARSGGFALFVAGAGGLFALMVVRLVTSMPREIHGSVLGLFAAPIAATVAWLVWRAWNSGWRAADGVRRVLSVTLPLLVGVALVTVPFVLYFAAHGAVHDLVVGVFVRPSMRLQRLWEAAPGRVATAGMLLAPLTLVVGISLARATSRVRTVAAAVVLGACAGLLALQDVFTAGSAALLVRGLPVMMPCAALLLAALRRVGRVAPADDAYADVTVLLVALAACSQLLQVPWASLSYALYAVPLSVLALVALLRHAHASPEPAVLLGGIFLIVAGYGHPATNADKRPPERFAPLPLPRAGLLVSPADSAMFMDAAALVAQRPGAIHVVGDAPEYVFLFDRPTPSRAIYDVLADSSDRDAATVMPALDRAGVRTVLLLNQFGYNDSTTVRQQRALAAAFPHTRGLGRRQWDGVRLRYFLEVRWRDSIAP